MTLEWYKKNALGYYLLNEREHGTLKINYEHLSWNFIYVEWFFSQFAWLHKLWGILNNWWWYNHDKKPKVEREVKLNQQNYS